jgi:molybdopterin synthase sulfur carrier subunit
MTIQIRYFASVRERLGRDSDSLDGAQAGRVSEIWMRATAQPLPPRLLAAVNLEHATHDQMVRDGDEVAFFPPVTGGQ